LSNKPWDTTAGVIIAREAGADVIDLDGTQHSLQAVATIAANPHLIDQIRDLISGASRRDQAANSSDT
jgi:myo-inositol-1(or 4)-monophosphatase